MPCKCFPTKNNLQKALRATGQVLVLELLELCWWAKRANRLNGVTAPSRQRFAPGGRCARAHTHRERWTRGCTWKLSPLVASAISRTGRCFSFSCFFFQEVHGPSAPNRAIWCNCDLKGSALRFCRDLKRGSNHKRHDLKVRFVSLCTAICGKFLGFGHREYVGACHLMWTEAYAKVLNVLSDKRLEEVSAQSHLKVMPVTRAKALQHR